jgi:hypothetical protein
MRDELQKVRDLADQKIRSGQEPPWAWYQYMKLLETANAILAGLDAATDSRQSALRRGEHLQLVASNTPQDNALPHQPDEPVQLPT